MITKNCTIKNKLGLHIRAASKLVDMASRFRANITLQHTQDHSKQADAKSIMALILLSATQGTELTLRAEGNDALTALDSVHTLINNRFGEDD